MTGQAWARTGQRPSSRAPYAANEDVRAKLGDAYIYGLAGRQPGQYAGLQCS